MVSSAAGLGKGSLAGDCDLSVVLLLHIEVGVESRDGMEGMGGVESALDTGVEPVTIELQCAEESETDMFLDFVVFLKEGERRSRRNA